ncbi:hypothetical protein ACSBR2_023654 [Camellia fascicularis]
MAILRRLARVTGGDLKDADDRPTTATATVGENGISENSFRDEQEEAMVALIDHCTKEVEHLRQHIAYYESQLDQAERRLEDLQSKLACIKGRDGVTSSKNPQGDDVKDVKVERRSTSPIHKSEDSS